MCDQQRLRPACAYAQSDQSLCKSLEYSMKVQLLSEQHLEYLSLKGGCTGWSECTLTKMPHRWKSHVTALIYCTYLPLLRRDTSSSSISSPNKSSTLLRWKTKKMLLVRKEELNRPEHEIVVLIAVKKVLLYGTTVLVSASDSTNLDSVKRFR